MEVEEDDVIPVTISLSRSGRMLFVGTSKGTLRSYKYPLTKPTEFQEHPAHTKSITRLKITHNDELALTTADDGTMVMWKIQDKEGRAAKRDKETGYAEEILITKSELEEKNQLINELKSRVDELKTENEYQMRLKEMSNADKMKELTERFMQEMEALKTKNQLLKSEKEKADTKHDNDTLQMCDEHNRKIQDIENLHNQKIMLEYDKYQELQTATQKKQEEYERQLIEMDQSKDKALNELEQKYQDDISKLTINLEKVCTFNSIKSLMDC